MLSLTAAVELLCPSTSHHSEKDTMSHSHPRPSPTGARQPRQSGARLAGAGGLVVAALLIAPWLARRLTDWPAAPALTAFVALTCALYVWFRQAQQTSQRTAAVLSVTYAALAAGALWLWAGG